MFLQNKFRLKSLLAGYERNSIRIVADGLVNHRARQQILKSLKGELRKYSKLCGLRADEVQMLWNGSYRVLNSTAKKTWGKKTPDEIYAVLRKDLIYSGNFTHVKNEVANRHEEMQKHDWIRNLLDVSDTPFYICDCHVNCAKGHVDYENKIYYDADYKSRYFGILKRRIRNYIRRNKLMSVQEVTGDGIWLITRPNCRHRLHPVDIDAVLDGDKIEKVVVDVDGGKGYAYGEMEFYYERGRILDSLSDVLPCKSLEADKSNNARLVKKWRYKRKTENL